MGQLLGSSSSEEGLQAGLDVVCHADSENKLAHRKLYLVMDLDETLVYSQRMRTPDAIPAGSRIFVRGQPFDMVMRPGLKVFLEMMSKDFVLYLYTMGDPEYTQSVLDVVDPEGAFFRGGVCSWRPSESRHHKTLVRTLTERRMTLIVDDTIDVWSEDLGSLCLTRRFVGDKMDDGLQLLASQLRSMHEAFYAGPGVPKLSAHLATNGHPAGADVRDNMHEMRGGLLEGCAVAFTGVVSDMPDEDFIKQPLCVLVRHYGGTIALTVDEATHLVARKKDGWKQSSKIRRAAQRQAEAGLLCVWEHWLLDSLCSWIRQPEGNYEVPLGELGSASPPRAEDARDMAVSVDVVSAALNGHVHLQEDRSPQVDLSPTGHHVADDVLLPLKRGREDEPYHPGGDMAGTKSAKVDSLSVAIPC